jgi:hypothetical protein
VAVPVPVEVARSRVGDHRWADGVVTPIDEQTCLLELASDSFGIVALVVGTLDVDFEVESPPELARYLRKLSERFADAARQWSRNADS